MKRIEEIYRDKLRMLVKEAGNQARLAERIKKAPAQISQWINASPDSKTGKPRVLDRTTARAIEREFPKPDGWMDTPLEGDEVQDDWPFPTVTREQVASLLPQQLNTIETVIFALIGMPEIDTNPDNYIHTDPNNPRAAVRSALVSPRRHVGNDHRDEREKKAARGGSR